MRGGLSVQEEEEEEEEEMREEKAKEVKGKFSYGLVCGVWLSG